MMFLYFFFGLASVYLGFVLVRKSWPIQYRLLLVLACLDFFVTLGSYLWSTMLFKSNHWIANAVAPFECALILYIFYKAATHRLIQRINIGLMIAIVPLLLIAYTLKPLFFILNTTAVIGCYFFILLSACSAFIDLLLDKRDFRLSRHPMFWLAGGMLLYGISNILCFVGYEFEKKMILYRFFYYDYYLGLSVIDMGIISCFISVYLQEVRERKSLQGAAR